jgi:hypothetical protein
MLRIVVRLKVCARTMPERSPLTSVIPAFCIADIGPGSHRDPDIRRRQGRGIVDPVPGHGDHAALRAQAVHDGALLLGQDLRFDLIDAELRRNGHRCGAMAPSTWRGLRLRRQIGTSSRVG